MLFSFTSESMLVIQGEDLCLLACRFYSFFIRLILGVKNHTGYGVWVLLVISTWPITTTIIIETMNH